jgi:hypothetical protein
MLTRQLQVLKTNTRKGHIKFKKIDLKKGR